MIALAALLAAHGPYFDCGYQPAKATMCVDQYGRLVTVPPKPKRRRHHG